MIIQNWVKSGIIKLIINPVEYDLNFRDKVTAEAKARVEKANTKELFDKGVDSLSDALAEQLALFYKNKSRTFVKENLLQMQQPTFTEEKLSSFHKKLLMQFQR